MRMRWLLVVVLVVAPVVSCDQLGDIDPVDTACDLCAILDESGICDMIQTIEAEKCQEGQGLVLTNVKAALEDGVPLETGCR